MKFIVLDNYFCACPNLFLDSVYMKIINKVCSCIKNKHDEERPFGVSLRVQELELDSWVWNLVSLSVQLLHFSFNFSHLENRKNNAIDLIEWL